MANLAKNISANVATDGVSVNYDTLSQIRFKYRYGLKTAKWKIDKRRFANIPVVALTRVESQTAPAVLLPAAAPPPTPISGFKKRDGTVIVVTATGNLYPRNLELRTPGRTKIKPMNSKTGNDPNSTRNTKSKNTTQTRTAASSRISSVDIDFNDYDDGYDDYSHEPVGLDADNANQTVENNNEINRNISNDIPDERDNEEGVSSWDEDSDEELSGPPPQGIDVSKVELLQSCPYCNLSFVGENGRILYSFLSRITSGKEAQYVEEHMDRCCLRQHIGQLSKCAECEKSYFNIPVKEARHWKKYHRDIGRTCPFEQCSDIILRSDADLTRHLTSAHYWKSAKSKSFVASLKKRDIQSFVMI